MQTGQIIAKLRTQMGLSQNQLAQALYVSRDLVSKWETGQRKPEYKLITAMAALFSVDSECLMEKDAILLTELSALLPENYPADADALKKDLNSFLSGLSVRDASVFVRRYYFLEEPNEIGTRYGISGDYVRTILMRTRKKLRRFMKGVKT